MIVLEAIRVVSFYHTWIIYYLQCVNILVNDFKKVIE